MRRGRIRVHSTWSGRCGTCSTTHRKGAKTGGRRGSIKDQTFTVRTSEREQILLITDQVQRALSDLTDGDGICTIVTPHTTCAISVNENADPDVQTDLTKALRAMIP